MGCIIRPELVKKRETSLPRSASRAIGSAETPFRILRAIFIKPDKLLDLPGGWNELLFMRLDKPLSERELDELQDFLSSDAVPEECMDIAMLHGFLTALVAGPSLVLPSEWLPVVWGEEEGPEFESEDVALRIFNLIMRLYDSVMRTLQDAPHKFVPLLYKERTAGDKLDFSAKEWCKGFVAGAHLRTGDWDGLVQDRDNFALLTPILALADEGAMEEILASSKNKDEKAVRAELLGVIPLAVAGMYDYWLSRRKERASGLKVDHPPSGRSRQVGRNEPCPCGSGKKFKKCCGAHGD